MRLQPSAASTIPARWPEFIAVDPCRPLETRVGNIVRAFIERTLAWIGRNRRMSKDYERLIETGELLLYMSMARVLLRRLAKAAT